VLLEVFFVILLRLGDLKLYVVETIAVGLMAGSVYLLFLYLLEHSPDSGSAAWFILGAAVLFRLTLFPLPPTLSDDLYRYRWDGRIQQLGYNPYAHPPDDPALAHLRDAEWERVAGREIPTVYPPLIQLVFRATYRILPGTIAFKLPFVLADLLLVGILAGWIRATAGRNYLLALYAWNPLVVVEFAASGHYDSLATAATVAACLLIIKGRGTLSTLLLAAAAMIKAFPFLLFPLWLRRAGWPRTQHGWILLFAAATVILAFALPYADALPVFLASMSRYTAHWSNNASLAALLEWFSHSREMAVGLGAGIVTGLSLWLAARNVDSVRAAYLLFGSTLLLSTNAFSWYFSWIIPFLCFFPNPAWLLLTVLQFLSYHVLIPYQASGTWRFEPGYLFLTYAPFFLVLAFQRWRAAREKSV
jgi:hypothetical protein